MNNMLNQLLADLNVLYRKLQNYHWNIKGKEFFVLQPKLEEYYDDVNKQIDEIAELILTIGGEPLGKLDDYLKISKIQEAQNVKVCCDTVIKEVAKDFDYIVKQVIEIKKQADNNEQYVVSTLMDELIGDYSKNLWMLKQSMQ